MIKFFSVSYFFLAEANQLYLLRSACLRVGDCLEKKSGYNVSALIMGFGDEVGFPLGANNFLFENNYLNRVVKVMFRERGWSRSCEIDYEWLIEDVMVDLYNKMDFCIGFCMTKYIKKLLCYREFFVAYAASEDFDLMAKLVHNEDVFVSGWCRGNGDGMFFEV